MRRRRAPPRHTRSNSQSSVTGTSTDDTYDIGAANFGAPTYDVTGPVALVGGDGFGCGTLTPVSPGTILLVDRGVCGFPLKAENAQAAGAAALVIIDSSTLDAPFIPSGTSAGVTIPVVGLRKVNGDVLKAAVAASETPTAQLLRRQPFFTVTALDGAFPDQAVGTTGPARRFAIQNTGNADGVIGAAAAATTTGPGSNGALTPSDDFLLSSNFCVGSTLAPGAACTLYIRFAPSSEGDINGLAGVGSPDRLTVGWAYFIAKGITPPAPAAGADGLAGANGAPGDACAPGTPGTSGASGSPGPAGPAGTTGAPGSAAKTASIVCSVGKLRKGKVSVTCKAAGAKTLVKVTHGKTTVARMKTRSLRLNLRPGSYVVHAGMTTLKLRV